jgi:hypothetical protein
MRQLFALAVGGVLTVFITVGRAGEQLPETVDKERESRAQAARKATHLSVLRERRQQVLDELKNMNMRSGILAKEHADLLAKQRASLRRGNRRGAERLDLSIDNLRMELEMLETQRDILIARDQELQALQKKAEEGEAAKSPYATIPADARVAALESLVERLSHQVVELQTRVQRLEKNKVQ